MSEVNLKRDRFAQAIRQGQREQKIREMRQDFNRITFLSNSYAFFNQEEFESLKNKCRQLNYSKESIDENFEFLENKNPIIFMECEDNVHFLGEINEVFWREGRISHWEESICLKIKHILKEYIQHIIQSQNNLADSYPSEPTLVSLFTFIHEFGFYHELWPLISLSKNEILFTISFHFFVKFVNKNIECLNSEEITSIAITLSNYRDNINEDGRDIFTEIISLVDNLCSKFLIMPNDMMKLVDVIFFGINQCPRDDQKLIQYISCETEILKNFLTYLDKRTNPKYLSFNLTTRIADFISRIFSRSDNLTLQEVFSFHPEIIAFIRSWLPIDEKVSIQDLSHFTESSHDDLNKEKIRLSHFGNKCTKYLIFALTNIVVSGEVFVEEIIINSDIWRVLIMLESVVAQESVEEIAIFIYNIVYVSSPEIIHILTEQSLPDILLSLLKQENSLILTKALSTILLVSHKLIENGYEEQSTTSSHEKPKSKKAWSYTKEMWSSVLESKGGKRLIERLLSHQNLEVANISALVFDLLF